MKEDNILDSIAKFKKAVIDLARNPSFVHHEWYVEYHLKLVEKIALELCEIYHDADKGLVVTLVWLHDYGKVIGSDQTATITEGRGQLHDAGFPSDFIDTATSYAQLIDAKERLESAPIEVKIVSSSDGAAHFVGPFLFFWWYENCDKPFTELMEDNITKIMRDWEKKIVLEEVKEAFKERRMFLLEMLGRIPDTYFGAKLTDR